MGRKAKALTGILLASAVLFSSISVGLSAWVSIDMKHDSAHVQQSLYTVVLKNGEDDANPTKLEGLERNSYFELPQLQPAEGSYQTFEGWKEQGGSTVYTGTQTLASFVSLPNNTLTLYASWTVSDGFIKVQYGNESQVTRIHLQDPYIFPLFNLHPTFTGLTKVTSYTYSNTGSRTITYRKRIASGYKDESSSASTLTFQVNDALILTSSNFPELDKGNPIVLTVA